MTPEDLDKTKDLERTIEAVQESRVIIGHTLSTVGFQGDPWLLVIDELQFALRPAAVTLCKGSDMRGNLIPEHHQLLSARQAAPGALKECKIFHAHDGREPVQVECRHYEFHPVPITDARPPMLQALIGTTRADEFKIGDWSLTLYYNRQSGGGSRALAEERLGRAVQRHFAYSVRHLCGFDPVKSPASLHQRFPTLIQKSPYLRLVLMALREQILAHLGKVNPDGFQSITANPFTLQYFLIIGTERMDGPSVQDPHLRYFPLQQEVEALQENEENLKKAIVQQCKVKGFQLRYLQPADFIRKYSWEATRSLIGYTFKTGAARYFPNWTEEPIVKGADDEEQERGIATAIMQRMRAETQHQFNIPLYVDNEIFGAIIVNTSHVIPWEAQALPVRNARQVGWVIDSALDMDPKVNDMARKIATAEAKANQVRAYRHMLYSLVHHEGAYCEMLDRLKVVLVRHKNEVPEAIRAWRPLIEYTHEDRQQLLEEFQDPPEDQLTGEANPVLMVAPEVIYRKVASGIQPKADVDLCASKGFSVDEIHTGIHVIESIFESSERLTVQVLIGPRLQCFGMVPALKIQVLRRILSNLLKNSFKWAKMRGQEKGELQFSLEIDDSTDPKELTINAKDTCGGIDAPGFPFGRISVQGWIGYLNELEKRRGEEKRDMHGMGFMTIAKYAEATGGEFNVFNWPEEDSAGTQINVRLGLDTRRLGQTAERKTDS